MELISFLVRSSRGAVVLAIAAGVVSGVSNAGLLAVINNGLRDERPPRYLLVAFLALCLIMPVTRFVSDFLLTRLGQGALFDLRMRLSRQILGAPMRHLEELGAHRLLATLTEDVLSITNAVLIIPILCINAAVLIGGLFYLAWLSWSLLLLMLACTAVGVAGYQFAVIKAMSSLRLAREQGDALMGHFRAMVGGTKELKLHRRRREAFLSELLQTTAGSLRRLNVIGMTTYSAATSWGQILIFVVIGVIVFVLPSFRAGSPQTLTGYTITLLYLITPLQVVMNSMPALARASISLKKVESLGLSLSATPAEVGSEQQPGRDGSWQRLDLINVTHTYRRENEEEKFVLGPINQTFRPGELVFITGGNGSGKTTLAKILVGIYPPESGEIRLDGELITDENREFYREHFAVVFSDYFLFDMLLGLDAPGLDEDARRLLAKLQLDRKVEIKNGALSTTALSQGQRKRLALLTAYLEDRPIYLFDEWAADQDPFFKDIFYLQLLPELKARGKAVIVISHDDHYYHVADHLIKLDYGKLEAPSPLELPA